VYQVGKLGEVILVGIGKVGRYIIIMLAADWSLSLF